MLPCIWLHMIYCACVRACVCARVCVHVCDFSKSTFNHFTTILWRQNWPDVNIQSICTVCKLFKAPELFMKCTWWCNEWSFMTCKCVCEGGLSARRNVKNKEQGRTLHWDDTQNRHTTLDTVLKLPNKQGNKTRKWSLMRKGTLNKNISINV